jgi:hypothetical protein
VLLNKRNKALNIIALNRVLKGEELNKRKVKEIRKAKYKIKERNRRVAINYKVIKKGNVKLRIIKRA